MKKRYFYYRGKKMCFFSCLHHEIIFYSAELFDSAFNFKLSWNIFMFLNVITNQASKEQGFNFIRGCHLFREQPLEKVYRSKVSGLQLYYKMNSFTGAFEDFGHILKKVGKIFRCALSLFRK